MHLRRLRLELRRLITTTARGERAQRNGGLHAANDALQGSGADETVEDGEAGGAEAEAGFNHAEVEAGCAEDWWCGRVSGWVEEGEGEGRGGDAAYARSRCAGCS